MSSDILGPHRAGLVAIGEGDSRCSARAEPVGGIGCRGIGSRIRRIRPARRARNLPGRHDIPPPRRPAGRALRHGGTSGRSPALRHGGVP